VIRLHSVSKEVGRGRSRRLVLDDINWTIPARSRYVILGHAGAGKTTLLNIISGSNVPTTGWVERQATICPGLGLARALAVKTPRLLAAQLARVYRMGPEDIIKFTAEFAGMDGAMDVPIASLPNSLRQRFGYALIYAIPFDFYLFDGRIGPQKGEFAKACRSAFDARCKEAGVILMTSVPRMAERFDGTAGILNNGKIEFFRSVREAVSVFGTLKPLDSGLRFGERADIDRDDDDEEWA
jgi:capsular polysaccharide transport system ATP-binding protein